MAEYWPLRRKGQQFLFLHYWHRLGRYLELTLVIIKLTIFQSTQLHWFKTVSVFSARQHIFLAHYMLSPDRVSVCPSVIRVDQSKTVKVRIMKFSQYGSPIPLFLAG